MATLARMQVDLIANTAAFRKDIESAGKTFTRVGKGITDVGKTLSTRITAPLVAASAGMFKLAADAAESGSKLDVVFGKNARSMNEWIGQLRNTVPETTAQLQNMTSEIQDLLIPLGMAPDAATEMTKSVVTLAADLASFNPEIRSTEEALEKVRAGLVGQNEPLLSFGVAITAADVKQEAFRLGLIKQGEDLNAAARAQAAFSLIVKGTAAAQGDAARTAASSANQLRFMWAETKEAATIFGGHLLPVLTPVVSKLRDMVTWVGGLSAEKKVLIITVGAAVAAIGRLLVVTGTLITSFGTVVAALAPVMASLSAAAAGFSLLNPPVLAVIATIGLLTAAWVKWGRDAPRAVLDGAKKIADKFKWLTGPIMGVVKSLSDMTLEFVALLVELSVGSVKIVSGIAEDIVHWLVDSLRPLGQWMWSHVLQPMLSIFTTVANKVSEWAGKITGFFNRMRGKVRDEEVAPMAEEVEGLFAGMFTNVASITENMKDRVVATMDTMETGVVASAATINKDVKFEMVDLSETMPPVMKTGTDRVQAVMDEWAGDMKTRAGILVADIGDEVQRVGAVLGLHFDSAFVDSVEEWTIFAEDIKNIISGISSFIDAQDGGFFGFLKDIGKGISDFFSTVFGGNNQFNAGGFDPFGRQFNTGSPNPGVNIGGVGGGGGVGTINVEVNCGEACGDCSCDKANSDQSSDDGRFAPIGPRRFPHHGLGFPVPDSRGNDRPQPGTVNIITNVEMNGVAVSADDVADTVVSRVAEVVDVALGERGRVTTRDFLGDMTVVMP